MKNILIVGASGHARVIIDIVEKQGLYRIAGLLDSFKPVGAECFGYRVLGAEQDASRFGAEAAIVAIGDNWTRARIAASLELPFVSAVHPSAVLARGVEIAEGAVVMAGAVLNSNARLGRHTIVNTRASLDHDSLMADFSSLAPGATVGGNVSLGEFSAVSIGATVIHGVTIGAHSVIGAGALVNRDIPDRAVAYGVPAKVVRTRNPGDRYL